MIAARSTPEAVVDKATKLELIYNRIHEIRMRFELLKREKEIEFLRNQSEGADAPGAGTNPAPTR
jgi:hypothetical protein